MLKFINYFLQLLVMKLILTRHGETIENKKGILQGQLDGKLSKEGIIQAKKLALKLKDEEFDAIYSSDLSRSADTAIEIAKYHPNTKINFIRELRERNTGDFTGMKVDQVDWKNPPKNIESPKDMRKRAKKILDITFKKYPKGNVLFVGHGGINKVLITIILNKPIEYRHELESQHNTALNIFEIKEDKKHIVHLINSIEHLK
jgi:broad specificity phosphatase PhoE